MPVRGDLSSIPCATYSCTDMAFAILFTDLFPGIAQTVPQFCGILSRYSVKTVQCEEAEGSAEIGGDVVEKNMVLS